jgi:hypothetical protein
MVHFTLIVQVDGLGDDKWVAFGAMLPEGWVGGFSVMCPQITNN